MKDCKEWKRKMLKRLDEFKNEWDTLYQNEEYSQIFRLPIPGYSNEEIAELESELGIAIHPTFRSVIQNINLDTVNIGDVSFNIGSGYIEYLKVFNRPSEKKPNYVDFLVNIGGAGSHFLILNNDTGTIYATAFQNTMQLEQIADNMEQFVLTSASIYLAEYRESDDYDPDMNLTRHVESDPVLRFVEEEVLPRGAIYLYKNEQLHKDDLQSKPLHFWMKFASRTV